MKKDKVYRTLLEAMITLANKKNQEFYHITKDDNGWYRVVKKLTPNERRRKMIIKIQKNDAGQGNYRIYDENDWNDARRAISRAIKEDVPLTHLIVSVHNPAYYRRFDGFKGYTGVTILT